MICKIFGNSGEIIFGKPFTVLLSRGIRKIGKLPSSLFFTKRLHRLYFIKNYFSITKKKQMTCTFKFNNAIIAFFFIRIFLVV